MKVPLLTLTTHGVELHSELVVCVQNIYSFPHSENLNKKMTFLSEKWHPKIVFCIAKVVQTK